MRRVIPRRLAPGEEAPLVEHLGELRARLVWCLVAIGAAFVVTFTFHDTIIGGSNGETITGGTGLDLLTGGGGDDVFLFMDVQENSAVITDFSRRPGNDDSLHFSAANFGLAEGRLSAAAFRAGPTNKAGDANDRFIFRKTDATLWFDGDGKGGSKSILIADMQKGAVVTAADIFLI